MTAVANLRREAKEAGIRIDWEPDYLNVIGQGGKAAFKMLPMNRPSAADVERAARPDRLLLITNATGKALEAAKQINHIAAPQIQYRLVAPGVVLIHDSASDTRSAPDASRQVRLQGRTGIVVESLLLHPGKKWSLQELGAQSQVSPALAHRVLARLERDGIIASEGKGPQRQRFVVNPRALAEMWSDEESPATPVLRGFLYGSSLEAVAKRLLDLYPQGVLGGTLAANRYKPVLTRVTPPLRIWIPDDFDSHLLNDTGWEETREGANVELVHAKGEPWSVHRRLVGEIPTVSPWRAWLEIAAVKGRAEELADALLTELSDGNQDVNRGT